MRVTNACGLDDSSTAESCCYDNYGNLTSNTTNGSTLSIAVDAATNRVAASMGAAYDEGGSMTGYGIDTSPFTRTRPLCRILRSEVFDE